MIKENRNVLPRFSSIWLRTGLVGCSAPTASGRRCNTEASTYKTHKECGQDIILFMIVTIEQWDLIKETFSKCGIEGLYKWKVIRARNAL
jgi:hypothetical protein